MHLFIKLYLPYIEQPITMHFFAYNIFTRLDVIGSSYRIILGPVLLYR
jgi:hypothetical protein